MVTDEVVEQVTQLFAAVKNGSLDSVKDILSNHFSSQTFRNLSSTLLHQAANNCHSRVLRYLVESGALVDSKNAQQMTPLHVSANKGDAKSVRVLLHQGANINAVDYDNRTPLYFAAYDGHVDAVKSLLADDNLDISVKRNGGWTALHEASRFGHVDVTISLLRAGAYAMARTDDAWWTPGHMASSCGRVECLKLLIEAGIDVNSGAGPNHTSTLLHEAAHQGHVVCVKLLLKSGAIPNFFNGHDLPHHVASRYGHSEVLDVLLQCFRDNQMQHLIDAFTNVDPLSNALTYHNALHMASLYGREECIKVLLAHSAKHLPNGMKQYPVMLAACKMHLKCMKILLADIKSKLSVKSIDPKNIRLLQSKAHCNALHYLSMKTYKTTDKTIACACLLLNSGIIDINQYDSEWDISTCLYLAARNGAFGLVQFLLNSGADPYLCESLKNHLLNNPHVKISSDLIEAAKTEPKSLLLTCRLAIRDALKERSLDDIYSLPLTKSMKDYLYHGHRVSGTACQLDPEEN